MYVFNALTGQLDRVNQATTDTSLSSATKIVAASDSIVTTHADYVCDGTADEVQINLAIVALGTKGGNVVLLEGTYNLGADIVIGRSKVTLKGLNSGATIINCNGAKQIISSGAYSDVEITGLHIKSSTDADGAVYINGVTRPKVHGCYFSLNIAGSGKPSSVNINASPEADVYDNTFLEADNTNGLCIRVNGSTSAYFMIHDNRFRGTSSGLTLIEIGESGSVAKFGKIYDNSVAIDTVHRFIKTATTDTYELLISNNHCYGTFTFCFDTNSVAVYLIGNVLISNGSPASSEGMIARTDCIIVGNVIKGTVPAYPYYIVGHGNVVDGNIGEVYYVVEDTKSTATNNHGNSAMTNRRIERVKNTSGGQLDKGDAVIRKAVAGGNEVTTTTTGGDPKVNGMMLETVANDAFGYCLIEGKTVSLKVNGTVAIAIGDLLSTFTSAKISKKALTGETSYAIALEAYSGADSDGVIDALLVTPRVSL